MNALRSLLFLRTKVCSVLCIHSKNRYFCSNGQNLSEKGGQKGKQRHAGEASRRTNRPKGKKNREEGEEERC